MIADAWRANCWNAPFGAGSEMSSGWLAAGVHSRGARASTGPSWAVSSVRNRARRGVTATFFPGTG